MSWRWLAVSPSAMSSGANGSAEPNWEYGRRRLGDGEAGKKENKKSISNSKNPNFFCLYNRLSALADVELPVDVSQV